MNVQSDFNIWIIEDRLNEVETFYLNPLERIAAELADAGAFPAVHVVMLGVNGVQQKLIKELKKLAPERYPLTKPKFHTPDIDHESKPENFVEFLRQEMGDKDVALIDPTVCGLGWTLPTGSTNFLYYVYHQVLWLKSAEMRDRVLLVSNVVNAASAAYANQMNTEVWGTMQEKTIGKFMDDTDAYDRKFSERLRPFLTPPDEWVKYLNKSGRSELVPFVERIRLDKQSKAIFQAIGRVAKWALFHLLFHGRYCAGDLIAATETRFCYDPARKDHTPQMPAELMGEDAEMYKALIRRFVIYGLRSAWNDFCPEVTANNYEKENPDHYKLWLEVTAADYFWYSGEWTAVNLLLKKLKGQLLTLEPEGKIDIGTVGISFRGKNRSVKYAYVSPGILGIRRDAQRFVRFLDGNISFKYTGETVKAGGKTGGSNAKFYYEVRFDGDEEDAPEDRAPAERWNKFWQNLNTKDAFFIKRRNHVDKLQSRLANRCYYITLEYMLICNHPMPEEADWWHETSAEVRKRLDKEGFSPEHVFDPERQSEARLATSRGT